jgi:2,5-diketo-D-gluconate reductase B
MMPYSSAIPQIGLGTSGRTAEIGTPAVLTAIEIGYRHIDTAQNYGTEAAVGEAIRRSGLPRSEFFVTTKVGDARLDKAQFMPSVERSLETLGFDQIDLLLIHWPSERDAVPFEEYMLELRRAQDLGYARLIGVSNFTIDHLERTWALLGPGSIATNQVEIHPYLQQPRLRDYARAHGLTLTAYQPLAKGEVASDPALAEIGAKHGVPATTVALAFLMAEEHAVIPASTSAANLKANLAARDLRLEPGEIARIRGLDRGHRRINPAKAPRWDD